MGRSASSAAASPPPIKQFTIQYFRTGKRTKPLTFELSSLQQARKLARIAGGLKDVSVESFTITSEDGRTERWLYLENTWRLQRR